MDLPWFSFVLSLLATWRVTYLISREDGPADVLLKLRLRAGTGIFGHLMDCFNCLSLWIALPFAFVVGRSALEVLLSWLALSGGACLLERTERASVTIREWPDTAGDDDGLLRRQTSDAAESKDHLPRTGSTGTFIADAGRAIDPADHGSPREKRPTAGS